MKFFYITVLCLAFLVACSALETISIKAPEIEVEFAINKSAHIYKHKKTGELLYCSNKHNGQPKDYDYIGTSDVPEAKIHRCSLAN